MKAFLPVLYIVAAITANAPAARAQVAASAPAIDAPLPASALSAPLPQPGHGPGHRVSQTVREKLRTASRDHINGPYPAPDDPSLVVYDYDPDYLYPVLVRTNEETHLVFAPDEEVVGVYLSDTGKRWLDHTALTKRDVFIEARLPGLDNAATIITSRRRYELDLRSSDDGEVYHRVSWHYFDSDAQMTAGQSSPFGVEYPANAPSVSASGQADVTTQDGALPTVAPSRSGGPRIDLNHANFDYHVDGNAPFAPVIAFDDGRFTYLQFPHRAELPAILVLDEKGEAEIASFVPLGNDFYEVQQTVTYGLLLKRGKQEVKVFNGRGNGCGFFGCDSSRMKNIYGRS
jgi:type IV secretory pathway VirB9-like protein